MSHNFYPQSKIDFIDWIESDESIGREFNRAAQIMSDTELAKYNSLYSGEKKTNKISMNHRDRVWDSGRKDWR